MTFVQGFYSFNVEVTNADQDVYCRFRVKTALHPHESVEHLCARALALIHSYEPDLHFSEGLFNPDQPAAWSKDVIDTIRQWIEVGDVPSRRLLAGLRRRAVAPLSTRYRVYFYSDDQIISFCNSLRGSKTNWIDGVEFFLIDPAFLESITPLIESSNHWVVTIVDDSFFMSCNGVERMTSLQSLDMWDQYQRTIAPSS